MENEDKIMVNISIMIIIVDKMDKIIRFRWYIICIVVVRVIIKWGNWMLELIIGNCIFVYMKWL